MSYIILTESKKSSEPPLKREDIYWSKVFGSFSKRNQATIFNSFDDTQPTVKKLRQNNPFVHAVKA